MNQEKFNKLRENYPNFIYENYNIMEDEEYIKLIYNFKIEGLTTFSPSYVINKKIY